MKSVFITGVGSGMGREGANLFHAKGWRVGGGGLDMMWNNAGIGESGWFEDVPYAAAMRVVDVLPGLIDTAILTSTPNHSDDGSPTRSAEEIAATAPKIGMFRLMPASSVAEAAWRAYHHPTRLHWYVPKSIRWIDRFKGLSPELVRGRLIKTRPKLLPELG